MEEDGDFVGEELLEDLEDTLSEEEREAVPDRDEFRELAAEAEM
jgi:hypothetical protein